MTIKANHPVRRAFFGCSDYYDSLHQAFCAFDAELGAYSLHLDYFQTQDLNNDAGRATIGVFSASKWYHCVGHADFVWFRIPSGKLDVSGSLK